MSQDHISDGLVVFVCFMAFFKPTDNCHHITGQAVTEEKQEEDERRLPVNEQQYQHGQHHAQHLAIGTSFAVMVFTTFSSMYAQHKKHAIDWATVRRMTPGMILGVLLGAITAKYMPTLALQVFFIAFLAFIALKTLRDSRPTPSRTLPALPGLTAIGPLFGAASSWVGIGGGSLSVPFLLYCNFPAHRAIG
ncbi:sulfite exporter TauE/SafE family protein, partial [Achromobacter xylosoxidans]|uniref:sulfite exporter TauE/SafE family protein n=1 Tax=Alcaligenes xylosoxydans xylosoxydans TaxID=85698 RepID=UPI001F0FD6D3